MLNDPHPCIVISSEARNLCYSRLRDTLFPHVCRAPLHFLQLSSFKPPVPYPPLRGTFPIGEGCFYTSRHLDPSTQFSYFQISHFLTHDLFLRSGWRNAPHHPLWTLWTPWFESRDEWFRVAGDCLPHSGIALYKNRCSGAFINRRLEMFLPTLFHPASALSAPSGHLPLEGKAVFILRGT